MKNRKKLLFLSSFLISMCLCTLVTTAYVRNRCKLEQIEMEQLVTEKSEKVQSVLTKLLYKTNTLSALVIQNNGDILDFERVAATIIDDPSIRNVLLAPDGVVTHAYPKQDNEQVLGLNYFEEGAGNQEAIQAKETGDLVLGGPFVLVQGGQALVGRLPVYLPQKDNSKKFWGIVSVTLNYPDALSGAELEQLKNQGYTYEIWRTNPDDNSRQTIALGSAKSGDHTRFVEKPLKILNASWYFRLSPIRNWYQFPETWILSLTGILLSLLISSLFKHNDQLKNMHQQLEVLTYQDSLTGILNRRGIFHQMQDLTRDRSQPFMICYLDINNFKSINDTYGHHIGDESLRRFAAAFQNRLGDDSEYLLGRIGGDEFILVIKHTEETGKLSLILADILAQFKEPERVSNTIQFQISFSFGTANFPADGTTIDDLINTADQKMYLQKRSLKQKPPSSKPSGEL